MFKMMLSRINDLYLGARVLIILDISYMSRFWTQAEAWLSLQNVGPDGLEYSKRTERRVFVAPIHNATETTKEDLLHFLMN